MLKGVLTVWGLGRNRCGRSCGSTAMLKGVLTVWGLDRNRCGRSCGSTAMDAKGGVDGMGIGP
eukprot:1195281-Prorocentrum_minimum.AAC.1